MSFVHLSQNDMSFVHLSENEMSGHQSKSDMSFPKSLSDMSAGRLSQNGFGQLSQNGFGHLSQNGFGHLSQNGLGHLSRNESALTNLLFKNDISSNGTNFSSIVNSRNDFSPSNRDSSSFKMSSNRGCTSVEMSSHDMPQFPVVLIKTEPEAESEALEICDSFIAPPSNEDPCSLAEKEPLRVEKSISGIPNRPDVNVNEETDVHPF